MEQPILVVMAAGMGSRYGGLKQMDAIGEHGEVIIDYSIHDALKAGFKKAVIIIKKEIEKDFIELVGSRLSKYIKVEYAYQEVDCLPRGYALPEERTKPWGTCQAVLSAKEMINGPFAVINADDYYGPSAFKTMYNYLSNCKDTDKYAYSMVGYKLGNTLTEHGHVARGVCRTSENGCLVSVVERTRIEKTPEGAHYTEDNGATWTDLSPKTIVSMNLWGFTPSFLVEAEKRFPAFLENALVHNPLKAEYFLPSVVSQLVEEDKAVVRVLTSDDKWYGVTYQADKPVVVAAIHEKHEKGIYPTPLWKE